MWEFSCHLTVAGIYFTYVMVVCAISVCVTMLVLRVYHALTHSHSASVPPWVSSAFPPSSVIIFSQYCWYVANHAATMLASYLVKLDTFGCPLVVQYWTDLQSMHGFRCYSNIARTRNVSQWLYSLYAWLLLYSAYRPLCLLLDSKSSRPLVVVGWKANVRRLSKCTQSRFARLLTVHYSIL